MRTHSPADFALLPSSIAMLAVVQSFFLASFPAATGKTLSFRLRTRSSFLVVTEPSYCAASFMISRNASV